jgi:hypothetical protein
MMGNHPVAKLKPAVPVLHARSHVPHAHRHRGTDAPTRA